MSIHLLLVVVVVILLLSLLLYMNYLICQSVTGLFTDKAPAKIDKRSSSSST